MRLNEINSIADSSRQIMMTLVKENGNILELLGEISTGLFYLRGFIRNGIIQQKRPKRPPPVTTIDLGMIHKRRRLFFRNFGDLPPLIASNRLLDCPHMSRCRLAIHKATVLQR